MSNLGTSISGWAPEVRVIKISGNRNLSSANKIVIKIGTSSLTDETYRLDPSKVRKFTEEIMELRKQRKEVILVTSGAIGAGIGRLNLKSRPKDMQLLQAAAAVGQNILMNTYDRYFNAS